jgi:crotonobetainyl-CoA:carnitine CoA-transferase CaiB-like acyl-CoA transferase
VMTNVRPLAGIRVLELGAYISGPYCGALLASLGADVVKVEPHGGEPFRRGAGRLDPYFMQYNAGKRSIAIDLKSSEGVDLVRRMLPQFDVVLENSRPGKTAALGLGPDDCRAINPGLVYLSITGFGDEGPLRDRPAYDSIGQSIAGHYSLMNDVGDEKLLGGASADLMTAITATIGVLAALVGRGLSGDGKGMLVQTSLMEAMSALTIDAVTNYYEHGVTPTRQARHPQAQAYCFATADGSAITLHLSVSDKFFQALVRAIGCAELATDPRFAAYRDRLRNYQELETILKTEFRKRRRCDWEALLADADVPFAPVLSIAEVVAHPQTACLELMEPVRDGLALVRPPFQFEGQRPGRSFAVPLAGQHTREIAAAVFAPDEVERLLADRIISEPPA